MQNYNSKFKIYRNLSKREQKLLSLLKKIKLSQSHGLGHSENVCYLTLLLAKKYKAKKEILIPACLLHDIGRINKKLHGIDSAYESCRLAKSLLKKAGYNQKETKLICKVISEHDKPTLSSKILESQILKDADFLDGFGVRGIFRATYWAGESGKNFEKHVKRLPMAMKKRYDGLEFEESRKIARNKFLLAQICFDGLGDYQKKPLFYKGKYIVLEGISGTGKETQAKLLKEFLEKKGHKTKIVYHPSKRLKETLKKWRQDNIDLFTEAFMFIADRHDKVLKFLLPALKKGKTVINIRNKISCLAYQAQNSQQVNLFEYLFSLFAPEPDIVFYFGVKPQKALGRINKRYQDTGEEKGKFENIRDLKDKQKKYKKIIRRYKNVVTIDASLSIKEIHKKIVNNEMFSNFF